MRQDRNYCNAAPVVALVTAVITAVVLAIGGAAAPAPARAAAQHSVIGAAPTLPVTRLTGKVTLPETSIDGPALSSITNNVVTESVIAWTGRDVAHHLNLETSTDGLNFDPHTKRTLNETSPFRPDVAFLSLGLPPGAAIILAWTGSDANHSLNVLFGVTSGGPSKLTLRDESSFGAPAILLPSVPLPNHALFLLAWTGVDANHSLNIVPITSTTSGLVAGQKTVLSQFSSNAGPRLAETKDRIVLAWTSRADQLSLATSVEGVQFPTVARLAQTSANAPATVSFPSEAGPGDWIGWTGTDAAHHLNLQWTTTFPNFPNPAGTKTTLSDTALGGPALAFNAGPQVAWTGTDPAHHLNIATFSVA